MENGSYNVIGHVKTRFGSLQEVSNGLSNGFCKTILFCSHLCHAYHCFCLSENMIYFFPRY